MNFATIAIAVLFTILFGLAICFSSYPLYRVYMLVTGFLSGFTFVMRWNTVEIDVSNLTLLLLAVFTGIVVGRLACVLFRLGVGIPSALLGIFVAYLLSQSLGMHLILAFPLVFVLFGAGAIRHYSYLEGDPYIEPRVNPPPDSQPTP